MTPLHKTLTIISICLFFTASAQVNPPLQKGRFGIGASTSLGFKTNNFTNISGADNSQSTLGAAGLIKVTYSPLPKLPITFGLGFHSSTYKDESGPRSYEDKSKGLVFQGSVEGILYVFLPETSPIFVKGGVTGIFMNNNNTYTSTFNGNVTNTSTDESATVLIAPIIQPEWFVSPYISIHTQIGVAISILNESNESFSEGGVNVQLFDPSDLLGQAGFTFYF